MLKGWFTPSRGIGIAIFPFYDPWTRTQEGRICAASALSERSENSRRYLSWCVWSFSYANYIEVHYCHASVIEACFPIHIEEAILVAFIAAASAARSIFAHSSKIHILVDLFSIFRFGHTLIITRFLIVLAPYECCNDRPKQYER